MAENIGIVIKTEADHYARVMIDRKGACGGCRPAGGGCRSCLVSAKMQSRVANPVNAKAGDLVKVHLSSANLFSGAAILYLIPVLGLLIGAFTGVWASSVFGYADAFGSMGGALGGLAIGFTVVIIVGRSPVIRRRITPTITHIVLSNTGMPLANKISCCD